jgi:hypothetical protein
MATAPPAPDAVVFFNIKDTTLTAAFNGNGTGGSTVLEWQIGYSTSTSLYSDATPHYVSSDGNTPIVGLTPGTTYYFWARGRNAIGWGDWSPRSDVTTDDVPNPPFGLKLSNVTDTTLTVTFSPGAIHGSVIDEYQIGYNTTTSMYTGGDPQYRTSDGNTPLTGFTPKTTYYFWARAHNAIGWSEWSTRASVTMEGTPDAPTTPVISSIMPISVYVTFSDNDNNGSSITDHQIGYGTSSSGPTTTVTSDGSTTISGLTPGATYYFWARAKNSYGWGPYSASKSVRTAGGVWILVGNTWKQAVPYVRQNGVWKVAQGWAKIAGVWKETA